ncbi:MAG: YceI family protein [Gemmatimonadaceae bacterium]|nr:YceI family protein [Gemmatimonadaceae bacterium]
MQWAIDLAHSQIQFSVKHMGISTVRGTFQQFGGTIEVADGAVTSAAIDIDVSSLNTGSEQRDGHLKSGDFFDTAAHPQATFRLTSFQRSGDDVTAQGDLTIRGVTHSVTLTGDVGGPSKDPWGNEKVSASLTGKISRKEWGLVWNVALEAGGMLVSDDVKLVIDVQAQPAA